MSGVLCKTPGCKNPPATKLGYATRLPSQNETAPQHWHCIIPRRNNMVSKQYIAARPARYAVK
jgi:hypothetical protein